MSLRLKMMVDYQMGISQIEMNLSEEYLVLISIRIYD